MLFLVNVLLCLQTAVGQGALDPLPLSVDHETEQHLLVDWLQRFSPEKIREIIESDIGPVTDGLVLREVKVYPAMSKERKNVVMGAFYGASFTKYFKQTDPRGLSDFNIYFLNDTRPVYDWRKTSKGSRLVNSKMFDLKSYLRGLKTPQGPPVIHATDNIQETKDNLRALGLYEQYYRRREFQSLSDVFDLLNRAGQPQRVAPFSYVVLRNFHGYPDKITVDEHLDVDLLCSDYFTAKRLLDSDRAVDEAEMRENQGQRVVNTVKINKKEVHFDLRHLGDDSYDAPFEQKILDTRVKRWGDGDSGGSGFFYVPDHDLWLHAVLYHALIQKPAMSATYKHLFSKHNLWGWGWKPGDPAASTWKENDEIEKLVDELVRFMDSNGFKIVHAKDKSVYYHRYPPKIS